MVVVYYTSTNFLDVILETIQSLKNAVSLHVVIEITPASKNSTIVNVDDLSGLGPIETGERVLGKEKWARFQPYFEGVASVQFVVHQHKKAISFSSLRTAFTLGRYLKKFKVDVLHFDTVSTRAIGLVPFLLGKKVFISLHDPAPHSGEETWKDNIPNYVFFPMAKGFFFYSGFAKSQFREHYNRIKKPVYQVKLQPYTFISQFLGKEKQPGRTILFFGRLSYYKGIDLLIEAIPLVLAKFPHEQFVIAGSPSYGYDIDEATIEKYQDNVTLLKGFLTTQALVKQIEASKFIVCPYRDATQSGVLMTAFAAGKMVVATNVGSFSEYIDEGHNGLMAEPTVASIAENIMKALANDQYKKIEKQLESGYSNQTGEFNRRSFLEAYQAK